MSGTVLVTGAGSGIGLTTALEPAAAGDHVVGSGLRALPVRVASRR